MQRRRNRLAQCLDVPGRHIVNLAVGDHNHPRKALARDIRHCSIKRRKQLSPLIAGAGLSRACSYHSDVEIGLTAELVLERGERLCRDLSAVADSLAW